MEFVHHSLSRPLSAQFEITNRCNHRCKHCYTLDSDTNNRPQEESSDDVVLSCAKKIVENELFSVVITGGEPLTKRNLSEQIIELFSHHSIKINLNSNITLFDENFITFLKKHRVSLLTSCPSSEANSFRELVGVDTFPLFKKKLRLVLDADIPCTVNMVVTRDNVSEIRETAKWFKQMGGKSFAVTPMSLNMTYPRFDLLLSSNELGEVIHQILWCEKEYDLKIDILEALPKCAFPEDVLKESHRFLNRKCQAARTGVAISPSGEVRPCAHNPTSYGNILETDLRDIWASMYEWRNNTFVPKECSDCAWLSKCYGGCRVNANTSHFSWQAPDIWFRSPLYEKPQKKNDVFINPTDDQILLINHSLRFRKEEEGLVVGFNDRDSIYFMVNNEFFTFIKELLTFDSLSFRVMKEYFDTTFSDRNDMLRVLTFLSEKRIIKISN